MSDVRFTPGPWHVDAHTNVMASDGLVAFPGISAGFDQKANARLISAAPELLEALQLIVKTCAFQRGESPTFDVAIAALAKATGEQQ